MRIGGIPCEIVGEGGVFQWKFEAEIRMESIGSPMVVLSRNSDRETYGTSMGPCGPPRLGFHVNTMGSHVKLHIVMLPFT